MDASQDAGLRSYMLGVYNYMALGVAFTGIITLFLAANPQLMVTIAVGPAKWVVFAALLGMGFFAPRLIFSGGKAMAHGAYWLYAALWGVLISPMVAFFLQSAEGQQDIARAFFITAATFGAMSLYGYTTKKDLSGVGRFLMMAAVGLLVVLLIGVFVGFSSTFSLLFSCGVVLVFAGITAYETQMIKSMYYQMGSKEEQNRAAIFGAFALYGSFITLFIHILNILGIMNNE